MTALEQSPSLAPHDSLALNSYVIIAFPSLPFIPQILLAHGWRPPPRHITFPEVGKRPPSPIAIPPRSCAPPATIPSRPPPFATRNAFYPQINSPPRPSHLHYIARSAFSARRWRHFACSVVSIPLSFRIPRFFYVVSRSLHEPRVSAVSFRIPFHGGRSLLRRFAFHLDGVRVFAVGKMGACISHSEKAEGFVGSEERASAKIVRMEGGLMELADGEMAGETLKKFPGYLICDSDGVWAGRNLSDVLGPEDTVQAGHLYFLLPLRKFDFVVTDSDMASLLAVTLASLHASSSSSFYVGNGRRRRKIGRRCKIAPFADEMEDHLPSFCNNSEIARSVEERALRRRGQKKKPWRCSLETIDENM